MLYSDFELQSEIATNFMNNKVNLAIQQCYNYISNQQGDVPDDYFMMLFDMLKVQNAKKLFDQAAEQYHKITGRLPPDWENREVNKMLSDSNVLVLSGGINASIIEKLNYFYEGCVQNHFGRLDLNQLNLQKSDSHGMNMLLKTLYKLKLLKDVEILLLGDNTILNFNPQAFQVSNRNESSGQQAVIKHDASLALLERDRRLKRQRMEEQLKQELEEYKVKRDEILKKQHELRIKINNSKGMMQQGYQGANKKRKTPEEELQELDLELAALDAQKPKPLEEPQVSHIERQVREQNGEVEGIDGISHNDDNAQKLKLEQEQKEIANKERLLMLLKLEILQWNGQEAQYTVLAETFRQKYQKFSPDYQAEYASINRVKPQNRIDSFEITTAEHNNFNSVSKNTPVIVSLSNEIHSHNLDDLTQYLDNIEPNNHPVVFINLKRTNVFNYEAANRLMLFMQQQKNSGRHYDLYIKNANSLIKVIFKTSGLSEYIKY